MKFISTNHSHQRMPNLNTIELEQLLEDYPILSGSFGAIDSTLSKRLFREVDESSFTLTDWLDSLSVLYHWLAANKLSLSPGDGIGYVSCTAKSVGSSPSLNHLPSLVLDFLNQYGCERATEK